MEPIALTIAQLMVQELWDEITHQRYCVTVLCHDIIFIYVYICTCGCYLCFWNSTRSCPDALVYHILGQALGYTQCFQAKWEEHLRKECMPATQTALKEIAEHTRSPMQVPPPRMLLAIGFKRLNINHSIILKPMKHTGRIQVSQLWSQPELQQISTCHLSHCPTFRSARTPARACCTSALYRWCPGWRWARLLRAKSLSRNLVWLSNLRFYFTRRQTWLPILLCCTKVHLSMHILVFKPKAMYFGIVDQARGDTMEVERRPCTHCWETLLSKAQIESSVQSTGQQIQKSQNCSWDHRWMSFIYPRLASAWSSHNPVLHLESNRGVRVATAWDLSISAKANLKQ